jgi:hypothetical protein
MPFSPPPQGATIPNPFDQSERRQNQYRLTLQTLVQEAEAVKTRLGEIESEKAGLSDRLQFLEATIQSLQPLCQTEEQVADTPALRFGCLQILWNATSAMNAPQIRDALAGITDLSKYTNPLAAIHTTLHRMPEVMAFKIGGKTYFELREKPHVPESGAL